MAAKVAGLYDMEDTLGSGHFAVVKSARHVFTGEFSTVVNININVALSTKISTNVLPTCISFQAFV